MDNFLKTAFTGITDKAQDAFKKGQDTLSNLQGTFDTKGGLEGFVADKITSGINGVFGKFKRLKGSPLSKLTDATVDLDLGKTSAVVRSNATRDPKDWRLSLSIPEDVKTLMQSDKDNLLQPLAKTDFKFVFPYTPTVLVGQSANWNPLQPVHTNYPFYSYENSRVDQMTITGDFYVQNEFEAKYWVAAVHYLRSMTKMAYGRSPNRGQPPPVVYLNGYGDFTFNNVPVIITSFQFDLKRDIDYISTELKGGENFDIGDGEQGRVSGKYAWAPSESLFTIGVVPQYSRTKQARFNLNKFIKGDHTLGGDGFI